MGGAVLCVTPLRSIRMRERTYNFSSHFRVGRAHRIVLTIVNYVTELIEN
jgi:hypothetical protein